MGFAAGLDSATSTRMVAVVVAEDADGDDDGAVFDFLLLDDGMVRDKK